MARCNDKNKRVSKPSPPVDTKPGTLGGAWRALDHQCLSHIQIFNRRVTELEMHSSRLGENTTTA